MYKKWIESSKQTNRDKLFQNAFDLHPKSIILWKYKIELSSTDLQLVQEIYESSVRIVGFSKDICLLYSNILFQNVKVSSSITKFQTLLKTSKNSNKELESILFKQYLIIIKI